MGADTYTLFSEKEGGPNRRDGHFGGKCGILDMQDFLIRRVEIQRLQRQNCPQLPFFCGGDARAAIARIPHAGQLPPGVGIFITARYSCARSRFSLTAAKISAGSRRAHAYTPPVRR